MVRFLHIHDFLRNFSHFLVKLKCSSHTSLHVSFLSFDLMHSITGQSWNFFTCTSTHNWQNKGITRLCKFKTKRYEPAMQGITLKGAMHMDFYITCRILAMLIASHGLSKMFSNGRTIHISNNDILTMCSIATSHSFSSMTTSSHVWTSWFTL